MVNSLHWYYLPTLGNTGDTAILEGDEWHHCHHVMRMQARDSIIVIDGKGKCFQGIIRSTEAKKGQIELLLDIAKTYTSTRSYKTHIGFAPTKNIDRTEFAIEKLTELGVDEICFLECDHSERSHLRMDRMEKIMVAAAKQSRKLFFPSIHSPVKPEHYIESAKNEFPGATIICAHLDDATKSIRENYSPGKDVFLLIGPEGGFSAREIDIFSNMQIKFSHLGPYRLRVETAAIASCVIIHQLNQ